MSAEVWLTDTAASDAELAAYEAGCRPTGRSGWTLTLCPWRVAAPGGFHATHGYGLRHSTGQNSGSE